MILSNACGDLGLILTPNRLDLTSPWPQWWHEIKAHWKHLMHHLMAKHKNTWDGPGEEELLSILQHKNTWDGPGEEEFLSIPQSTMQSSMMAVDRTAINPHAPIEGRVTMEQTGKVMMQTNPNLNPICNRYRSVTLTLTLALIGKVMMQTGQTGYAHYANPTAACEVSQSPPALNVN